MSTKTNFKRIALVAVAALGLGVLSSVPSQAGVTGSIVITATNGNATTALVDSTTAGTIKVRALVASGDSILVTVAMNAKPTLATTSPSLGLIFSDTSTSMVSTTTLPALSTRSSTTTVGGNKLDTAVITAGGSGYVSGTFLAQIDTNVAVVAGTYTYTITATPYATSGGLDVTKVATAEYSIVVTSVATESTTASSSTSTAVLSSTTSSVWNNSATDSTLAFAGTAAAGSVAAVKVSLLNASSGTAPLDSLTINIDKGNASVSTTTTCGSASGKSLTYAYSAATVYVCIYPDGSTGTSTLTIATKNAGTFTKTVTFYGTAYATITAAAARSVIGIGAEATLGAVSGTAADANKSSYGSATAVYAYSSDTTVISNYGTACTWNATLLSSYCALTGVKAGTANITLRDASTVALSTVSSSAVAVRVSAGTMTSFTLKTDKATYAPGEKGYLMVAVKDAAGLAMPVQTSAVVLASGGITSTAQLGNSSDTLTATTFSTESSSTPASLDPVKVYTFFAPVSGGTFTFSAKGASTLSAASQATATTVSVSVTDSGAAALAAVTALATTVASLKTLITTLTNLVLKIQKKVKA